MMVSKGGGLERSEVQAQAAKGEKRKQMNNGEVTRKAVPLT